MEEIIAAFIKANPYWAFIVLTLIIILPVPSHLFMMLKFLNFIREMSSVNQVLFNRFEELHKKNVEASKENTKFLGVASEAIRKCSK